MAIPMKVAPSGFPKCRSFACGDVVDAESGELANDVFNRKSCVIAMPMEAKERDVRSQAKKVRSRNISVLVTVHLVLVSQVERERKREGGMVPYPELNDL
jgi:hypothetical protein